MNDSALGLQFRDPLVHLLGGHRSQVAGPFGYGLQLRRPVAVPSLGDLIAPVDSRLLSSADKRAGEDEKDSHPEDAEMGIRACNR